MHEPARIKRNENLLSLIDTRALSYPSLPKILSQILLLLPFECH